VKLKDLSLDKLKIVLAIKETGSLSKAAQQLFVTPSAVSQSLVALEDQLGKQLFIRRGKILLPTEYCLKLIGIYEPFSQSISDFLLNEASESQKIKGQVKVFIPNVVGPLMLAKPFAEFLNQYPDVKLGMDSGAAPRALQELHNNNFDFAICGLKKLIAQHRWCESTEILNLTMNLYCSKEFYQKHKSAIRNKDYDSLYFLTGLSTQFMLDWYFEEILNRKFRSPSRMAIYDMNFSVKAVGFGLGIGLLAKELVQNEINDKSIIEIGPKPLMHPLYLIRQKQKALSAAEKAFYDFTLDYFTF
jgi:DNA-binding transcriptional LysR family regulator